MPKLNCWEHRQVQNMYEYMQAAEDVSVKIGKLYGKAFGYISTRIDEIYEKHQIKYKLTNDEAIQLLSIMQDRTSISELMEKIRESSTKDENRKAILSQLESVAYKSRLESLQQLLKQIDYVMSHVYKQEKDFNTTHYVNLANEAYYKGIYDMQQMENVAFSFDYVDTKTINCVIHSTWSGKNYSDRILDHIKNLVQEVKEELLIHLVTGRTNKEVADLIANKYHIAAFKARRLIRTESNYVANEMKMKAYVAVGVKNYRYLAELERHTSEICRNMEGRIFAVSERRVGVNCPPLHPWCRSTTIPLISEDLHEKLHFSAKNSATVDINYLQWYDKYVKGKEKV